MSADIAFDPALLDEDIAVLGRKGGGKTYTSKGLVERLLDMRRRVLILDPLGVWAGLRTAADGEREGYPVAIFGGQHGDLPLEPAAAVPMADVIARNNVPAVLDISELSKSAQQSFLLAFLRELRRVNTEALTLVLEEADVFAPQNPMGDDSKALHAEIDWICRRGRFRGFRLITITQRPARLSKDVLTQAATLIMHRLPAPQDRDAVKAWVDGNGDRDQAKEVFDTLARLDTGEAWVWSTVDNALVRMRFPKIKTLDTSATPKAGEKRIEPKTLAQVDLGPIRTALAEASAAEKGPKGKPPSGGSSGVPAAPDPKLIEAAEERGRRHGYIEGARQVNERLLTFKVGVDRLFDEAMANLPPPMDLPPARPIPADLPKPIPQAPAKPVPQAATNGKYSGPQQAILNSLATWLGWGHDRPTNAQVAFLAGYTPTSTSYTKARGALKSAGLVDYPLPDYVSLTDDGMFEGHPLHVTTVADAIRPRLSGPELAIFDVVVAAYPAELSNEQSSKRSGYSPTSTSYTKARGSLRTKTLIDYPRPDFVVASSWLFAHRDAAR